MGRWLMLGCLVALGCSSTSQGTAADEEQRDAADDDAGRLGQADDAGVDSAPLDAFVGETSSPADAGPDAPPTNAQIDGTVDGRSMGPMYGAMVYDPKFPDAGVVMVIFSSTDDACQVGATMASGTALPTEGTWAALGWWQPFPSNPGASAGEFQGAASGTTFLDSSQQAPIAVTSVSATRIAGTFTDPGTGLSGSFDVPSCP